MGTLTVLPVGFSAPTPAVAGRAMMLAPLAVLPLAVGSAAACWAASAIGWPPLLVGLIGVAVLALGTRALHLDGLADTVDGLGCGGDRGRALAIMRRGDIGPMGALALIVVIGVQAAAIGQLVRNWPTAGLLLVIICASRTAVGLCCVRGIPAARPDGLGAAVAGSVPRAAVVVSWLIALGVITATLAWIGARWWLGPVAIAVALSGVVLLLRHCVQRFGGVTGDVIGAGVETAFTLLLLGALSA